MPDERTTHPVPATLRTLCERLRGRADLQGVAIHSAPTGETEFAEAIVFGRVDSGGAWAALGRMRTQHEFTVHGTIAVRRSGSDEEVIDEVRVRAFDFVNAIMDEITATVAGHQITDVKGRRSTLTTKLGVCNLEQDYGEGERHAYIDFTIDCMDQTVRG